jgi:AraC family transcriptional regulator
MEMKYRIEQIDEFSIIGFNNCVKTKNAFNEVPEIWAEAREKGIFEQLWQIRKTDHKIKGILGVCANGDFGKDEEFDYILAIVSEQSASEQMIKMDFPEASWAVFEVQEPEGIQQVWEGLRDWISCSEYDLANLPAIECYLPIEENKNELWVPIHKKTTI